MTAPRLLPTILLAVAAALALPATARATTDTVTWTGGAATENWSDDANWDAGVAPDSDDVAEIPSGAVVAVDEDTAVGSVKLLNSATVLKVEDGVTLTLTGSGTNLSIGLAGTVWLQGAGSRIDATSGDLAVDAYMGTLMTDVDSGNPVVAPAWPSCTSRAPHPSRWRGT